MGARSQPEPYQVLTNVSFNVDGKVDGNRCVYEFRNRLRLRARPPCARWRPLNILCRRNGSRKGNAVPREYSHHDTRSKLLKIHFFLVALSHQIFDGRSGLTPARQAEDNLH